MALFHKIWLFLWIILDWFIFWTETRVISALEKHVSHLTTWGRCFPSLFKDTAKQLCRGTDTSLMILSVCVCVWFHFCDRISTTASSFTVKHAWACPIAISLEVCYGYLTKLSLISFVHNREETVWHTFVEITIAVSSLLCKNMLVHSCRETQESWGSRVISGRVNSSWKSCVDHSQGHRGLVRGQ